MINFGVFHRRARQTAAGFHPGSSGLCECCGVILALARAVQGAVALRSADLTTTMARYNTFA